MCQVKPSSKSSGGLLDFAAAKPSLCLWLRSPRITRKLLIQAFPLYTLIPTIMCFLWFAGFRKRLEGRQDVFVASDDGALPWFPWVRGYLSGFLRLDAGCAMVVAVWSTAFHMWLYSSAVAELIIYWYPARSRNRPSFPPPSSYVDANLPLSVSSIPFLSAHWYKSLPAVTLIYSAMLGIVISIASLGSTIFPSQIWTFSSYSYLTIPPAHLIADAMDGMCPTLGGSICLSESEWSTLSNGLLSSLRPADVAAVGKGLQVAWDGGLVVNILARDTSQAIPALKANVAAIVPFFKPGKVAVVVFENDSIDGSRELFQTWKEEEEAKGDAGAKIDLITCEALGSVDCKLKETHRYDLTGAMDSSVGRMAAYRNHLNKHIVSSYNAEDFTHMLITDIDLAVSISPLGLVHSLGIHEHEPVVARGIMMTPGAFGTLYTPYDFSAFRPLVNDDNRRIRAWHTWFCELAPPGSRFRNNCDVVSPWNLVHALALDMSYVSSSYPVVSAFHGATIYPFDQVKASNATYDTGDDGQRCEHIGFNMGLCDTRRFKNHPKKKQFSEHMYVNPKWTINLDPSRPGGPTGKRFYQLVANQGMNVQYVLALVSLLSTHAALCLVVSALVDLALTCTAAVGRTGNGGGGVGGGVGGGGGSGWAGGAQDKGGSGSNFSKLRGGALIGGLGLVGDKVRNSWLYRKVKREISSRIFVKKEDEDEDECDVYNQRKDSYDAHSRMEGGGSSLTVIPEKEDEDDSSGTEVSGSNATSRLVTRGRKSTFIL